MAAPFPPPAAPPIAAPAPAPIKPPPTARCPGSYGFVQADKPSANANAIPPGARNAFVMSSPIQPEIGKHNAVGLGSRGEPRVSRTRDVAVLRLHRPSRKTCRAGP